MTRTDLPKSSDDDNLINVRTAVILLAATVVAISIGVLSFRVGGSLVTSSLTAGSVWTAAIVFLHHILIRRN
jgi:hypothetical protein